MRISVTEAHIKAGKPHDSTCCPVQLALEEHGMSLATHEMPDVVRIWIKGYDRMGGQGLPFEFDMEPQWHRWPTEERG